MNYGELIFLVEAAETLAKTRRILKWSYCFAYYLDDAKKRNLFEFHQKDLETYCEELHELLEIKFTSAIKEKGGVLDLKSFLSYKSEVEVSNSKTEKVNILLILMK